jgi:hypothetical protein
LPVVGDNQSFCRTVEVFVITEVRGSWFSGRIREVVTEEHLNGAAGRVKGIVREI